MVRMGSVAMLVMLFWAGNYEASEIVRAVQGRAESYHSECLAIRWRTDTVFHNSTEASAVVELRGVSNGVEIAPELETMIVLSPGTSRSVRDVLPDFGQGLVTAAYAVPAGVLIESRVEIFEIDLCSPRPPDPNPRLGVVKLPVFRDFVPRNQEQIHLGIDLGAVPARVNFGAFNAAGEIAHARVDVRRACDDELVATYEVELPPGSFVQTGLGPLPESGPCSTGDAASPWNRYAIVKVDQPGFTYLASLANSRDPLQGISISKAE